MKTKHMWNVIDIVIRAFAISLGAFFMLLSLFDLGTQSGMIDFLFGGVLMLFGLGHDPRKFHTTVYIETKRHISKEDAEDLAETVRDK